MSASQVSLELSKHANFTVLFRSVPLTFTWLSEIQVQLYKPKLDNVPTNMHASTAVSQEKLNLLYHSFVFTFYYHYGEHATYVIQHATVRCNDATLKGQLIAKHNLFKRPSSNNIWFFKKEKRKAMFLWYKITQHKKK